MAALPNPGAGAGDDVRALISSLISDKIKPIANCFRFCDLFRSGSNNCELLKVNKPRGNNCLRCIIISMKSNYRPDLQGIRAVAVTMGSPFPLRHVGCSRRFCGSRCIFCIVGLFDDNIAPPKKSGSGSPSGCNIS